MIKDEKKFIKEFRKFVKEVRKLNDRFGVGRKFNYRVMAYIHVKEVTEYQNATLFTDVYENPFRIDLRKLEFLFPDVVQTIRKKRRRINEEPIELKYSWRKFNVRSWIKRMLKK
ncbi:MAG: hypothetical protein DRO01_00120 [Thermoproteota archaeon]|nr:MAG: hypothetical protein DRO01_00120 [Candidatus Korarchaeota archaeon]